MFNPWLKKNPFMSMWLSSANRMAGSLRGQATAHIKRQVKATVSEATGETLKLRSRGATPAAAKSKRRR